MASDSQTTAIELSALREEELVPLLNQLDSLDLRRFDYISFHAPSQLKQLSEIDLVRLLQPIASRGWPVIVHPDIITDISLWTSLGNRLCIENMDKRKSVGRTCEELTEIFTKLPQASLCFDIGHARQIDPTMCEANRILRRFGDRIGQIHLSLVDSSSVHEPLNYEGTVAFQRVAHLLPREVPVILETPVTDAGIMKELCKVELLLA